MEHYFWFAASIVIVNVETEKSNWEMNLFPEQESTTEQWLGFNQYILIIRIINGKIRKKIKGKFLLARSYKNISCHKTHNLLFLVRISSLSFILKWQQQTFPRWPPPLFCSYIWRVNLAATSHYFGASHVNIAK